MKVTKLTSCMNLRMIQVVIKSRSKCFKRSTVERIEEKSNEVSAVCLYDLSFLWESEVYMKDVFLCHFGSINCRRIVNMSY